MKKHSIDAFELFTDLMAALMFLSRIPVPWEKISPDPPDLTRAFWAFPLVGLVLGSLSGLAALIAHLLGLSSLLSVIIGISIGIILTGALHEDGLADTIDGLGGGSTNEEKLEIMRDSRIGTYGTIALVICLMLRLGALLSLANESLLYMFAGFAVSSSIGRGMIVFLRSMSEPASETGLSTLTEKTEGGILWAALGIAFFSAVVLSPIWVAVFGFALCILLTYLINQFIVKKLGGITGDILGATEQTCEMGFLLLFAAMWGVA